MKRSSEWGARIALLALGLVLAVPLLEAGLQLGAAAVWLTQGELSLDRAGGRRILCLGDSNTYGVWLERRELESWPAQLQALWPQHEGAPGIEVLNAGYPGTNSSRLLRELPRLLEAIDPDLVIVMVGVNDFWTAPVEVAPEAGGAGSFLRRHSRVVRAYRLLRQRLRPARLEVVELPEGGGTFKRGSGLLRFGDYEFSMGWRWSKVDYTAAARALERNLRALAEQARARGVELWLTTYPAAGEEYGLANASIRAAADAGDLRLIDLERVFRPLCPDVDCSEWLHPDQHPRAAGYRVVAETLLAALSAETAPQ